MVHIGYFCDTSAVDSKMSEQIEIERNMMMDENDLDVEVQILLKSGR